MPMSVEIDVGLENAGKVKVEPVEPPKKLPTPTPLTNPKVRRGLLIGGIVVALVVLSLFLYFHDRESTDDAQVDGHITPVASKIYGRVGKCW
jgi:multidrug resistance efflux pump